MADNIFDAQRDRRMAVLQQQSVSSVVRSNPNLRGVLTRYEDAEVSRLHLLELQRLRSKKITAGERALLKTLRKGRRATGGGGRQKKQKETKPAEPPKSQTQIEVDAEEKRRKLRQQDRFLELEDFKQQRDFIANERTLQQRELQRQTDFATGQNRILADAQIAQFNQAQRLQIENRKVARSDNERRARIRESDNQLRGIQDRVARDDAYRHAQLQEQQQLALAHLAGQQKDNERRHQEQQHRIDNQRAVDADRAVSDREIIGGLQSRITQLERQQFPEGQGKVEDVEDSPSGQSPRPKARAKSPSPEPEPEATLSSQPVKSVPAKQRQLSLQPKQRKFERRSEDEPIQEGQPTPGTLREKPAPKPKRFEGGATEAEIQLELQPQSSIQSVESTETSSIQNVDSTPASTLRSKSPEVYRPKVKTLKEVREDNPVGGGD